jgi:hypothetical protein
MTSLIKTCSWLCLPDPTWAVEHARHWCRHGENVSIYIYNPSVFNRCKLKITHIYIVNLNGHYIYMYIHIRNSWMQYIYIHCTIDIFTHIYIFHSSNCTCINKYKYIYIYTNVYVDMYIYVYGPLWQNH